jgi:hypothetical protein
LACFLDLYFAGEADVDLDGGTSESDLWKFLKEFGAAAR